MGRIGETGSGQVLPIRPRLSGLIFQPPRLSALSTQELSPSSRTQKKTLPAPSRWPTSPTSSPKSAPKAGNSSSSRLTRTPSPPPPASPSPPPTPAPSPPPQPELAPAFARWTNSSAASAGNDPHHDFAAPRSALPTSQSPHPGRAAEPCQTRIRAATAASACRGASYPTPQDRSLSARAAHPLWRSKNKSNLQYYSCCNCPYSCFHCFIVLLWLFNSL